MPARSRTPAARAAGAASPWAAGGRARRRRRAGAARRRRDRRGRDPYSLGTGAGASAPTTDLAATCRTGSDANQREDCRIVAVVNSVQAYWERSVDGYREAATRFFTGSTTPAAAARPQRSARSTARADQMVYIDLGFYDELRARFGARAARSPRRT